MERMDTQEKLDRLEINYDYLKEENDKLKKENKKLKEEEIKNSKLYWDLMKKKEEYVEKRKMSNWKNNLNIGKVKKLEEENKKLREEVKDLVERNIELDKKYMLVLTENKKLREKVETLELWLDNKEKLNEEYRKQIDKYKRQYEHSMGEDDELIYEEGLYD